MIPSVWVAGREGQGVTSDFDLGAPSLSTVRFTLKPEAGDFPVSLKISHKWVEGPTFAKKSPKPWAGSDGFWSILSIVFGYLNTDRTMSQPVGPCHHEPLSVDTSSLIPTCWV